MFIYLFIYLFYLFIYLLLKNDLKYPVLLTFNFL